jgi:hypothetical protein
MYHREGFPQRNDPWAGGGNGWKGGTFLGHKDVIFLCCCQGNTGIGGLARIRGQGMGCLKKPAELFGDGDIIEVAHGSGPILLPTVLDKSPLHYLGHRVPIFKMGVAMFYIKSVTFLLSH